MGIRKRKYKISEKKERKKKIEHKNKNKMKSARLNMIWCVNQRFKAAIAQIQQFEMEYAINEIHKT